VGEIVNLRLVKKRKTKDAKEKLAAENRVRFGRTKVEKQFEREATGKSARFLDDNRLERSNEPDLSDAPTDKK
jgi:hypothetical protein